MRTRSLNAIAMFMFLFGAPIANADNMNQNQMGQALGNPYVNGTQNQGSQRQNRDLYQGTNGQEHHHHKNWNGDRGFDKDNAAGAAMGLTGMAQQAREKGRHHRHHRMHHDQNNDMGNDSDRNQYDAKFHPAH